MLVLIIGLHVASVGTEQIQTIFLYKVFFKLENVGCNHLAIIFSIKAPAKWRNTSYVLMEICHQQNYIVLKIIVVTFIWNLDIGSFCSKNQFCILAVNAVSFS